MINKSEEKLREVTDSVRAFADAYERFGTQSMEAAKKVAPFYECMKLTLSEAEAYIKQLDMIDSRKFRSGGRD